MTEVLLLILSPPPENPFAVDLAYWDTVPVEEAVFSTGAMIDFLQRVYYRNPPYSGKGTLSALEYACLKNTESQTETAFDVIVLDDLDLLYRKHFELVESLVQK